LIFATINPLENLTMNTITATRANRSNKYTVHQHGWCYRATGKYWGITGTVSGLNYHDVCAQLVNASKHDEDITILRDGRIMTIGEFANSFTF
jgi:hypothetical protein